MSIRPFQIHVSQSDLADLQDRLSRVRWPYAADESAWDHGIPLGFMKEIVDHWLHRYDWRQQEAALNAVPQFLADVKGVDLHFIHVKGRGPNPTPLLLIHGFPDSFYRYHKVIDRLTDPAKFGNDPAHSFDVVIPSVPGTGFSGKRVFDQNGDAEVLTALMTEVLGYQSFVTAGGDRGSIIGQAIARQNPGRVKGLHLTDVGYPDQSTDFATLTRAEMEMAQWVQKWFMEEGIGVNMIMATKPLTLSYGLSDSPVGLAAWILSYSSSGLRGRDEFKTRFSLDELITNVCLHWFTGAIATTTQSYQTYGIAAQTGGAEGPAPVPTAVAHCPYDPPLPREWAARRVNLTRYSELARGGHFAAWEEPDLFADDLRGFLGDLSAGGE